MQRPSSLAGIFVCCGLIGLALGFALIPRLGLAFELPPNDGFVTDAAGILTAEDREQIVSLLQSVQQRTSNEIAVLIVPTLNGESIADVAVEAGRKWGVGTERNNGILLLISYQDREVFLATGYGLEGAVPDIVAKGIIEEEIAPRFRDGEYAAGIRAGIEALEKHIGGEYTPDRYARNSTTGGGVAAFVFFAIILGLQWLVSFLGSTKSWWLGGAIGALAGCILAILYAWWWSVPALFILGLLIDYLASKTHRQGRPGRRGGGRFGGFGGTGGSSGGGFGGFGGGSFGGGGAGGKW